MNRIPLVTGQDNERSGTAELEAGRRLQPEYEDALRRAGLRPQTAEDQARERAEAERRADERQAVARQHADHMQAEYERALAAVRPTGGAR
jgi:hypothetical protein